MPDAAYATFTCADDENDPLPQTKELILAETVPPPPDPPLVSDFEQAVINNIDAINTVSAVGLLVVINVVFLFDVEF